MAIFSKIQHGGRPHSSYPKTRILGKWLKRLLRDQKNFTYHCIFIYHVKV